MGAYLKKYDIELTTLGPVFIGSGYNTNKKEAIFFKNKVVLIDTKEMFEYLIRRNLLRRYQEYMLDFGKDLAAFLKENNIGSEVYEKWKSKTIPLFDAEGIGKGKTKKCGIERFVRDGRERVYVPGSSLKGMLRTILTGAYMLKNKEYVKKICDRLENTLRKLEHNTEPKDWETELSKDMGEIDAEIFHKNLFSNPECKMGNKVNDSLRGFMVSDSEYIADEDMCICQKLDFSLSERKVALPLYRECIKPNVKIRFSITIDSSFCKYSIEDILEAIEIFSSDYKNKFTSNFTKAPKLNNKYICYLGGGAGFVSKTIIYPSFEKTKAVKFTAKWLNIKFKDVDHDKDTQVSPRMLKCTRFNNTVYQFGACCLSKYSEDSLKSY